ncbi:hypothetical protein NQ176_g9328 [Zarea fungicola]|uniref:Uncharacterized protein n=1 Tax=Zarea fungicola TaxID=93591 RepID=A0ACC1MMT4_9HYPO|nr:hypothetical protein NQ176_g9328 [Lecanicillium fungicola]
MSAPIKNVTLAGATGNIGTVALEKFTASKFNVQVLRRLGSKSTFPPHITVIDVDYNSVDGLTAALKNQDALISTIPASESQAQRNLIDAAIAAGVRRYIPSEFGCNIDNANTRAAPIFGSKVVVQEYLKEKAAAGLVSYTLVYTGPMLDWGLEKQFIINTAGYKPVLFNDGKAIFSTTNIDTIGRALVAILEHFDETNNRAVYLEDLKTSQLRLVELAKQAAPEKPWEVSFADLDEEAKKAGGELAKGNHDFSIIRTLLLQAIVSPSWGINFAKSDNELLGLGTGSEEQVVEVLKKIIV